MANGKKTANFFLGIFSINQNIHTRGVIAWFIKVSPVQRTKRYAPFLFGGFFSPSVKVVTPFGIYSELMSLPRSSIF